MVPVALTLERRHERRRAGGGVRWSPRAVLRPGQAVTVINITSRAALVESSARLRPGAQTNLHLAGPGDRACVRGHLDRCFIVTINPLRYRGVVCFDDRVDVGESED